MPLSDDTPVDEVYDVCIEAPDESATPLAEIEIEAPESPSLVRGLGLSRGGMKRSDPETRAETKGNEDQSYRALVVPDEYTAIGIYLNTLEQHGLEEDPAIEGLREIEGIDFAGYEGWRDSLTMEDRRERLLADARDRNERSPHVGQYLDRGSWRTVEDTEKARTIATKLWDGLEPNPRRCYRNAVLGLKACKSHDRVQYVEGMALPKQGGRAVAHSWLELDGVVMEVTWPWHQPLPPEETVYYGVCLDAETVFETHARRNAGFNPILLDDEFIDQRIAP